MRRRGNADQERDRAAERAQPPLIPMSHDELDEAGRELAGLIAELEDMEAAQAATRKERAEERAALRGRIGAIASTIRSQGR